MSTLQEESTTSIFGLFESPDWRRFKSLPEPVQHDIRSLLLLNLFAKSSISEEIQKLCAGEAMAGHTERMRNPSTACALLTGELYICLLSTAVGKELKTVPWNSLAAERAIECLGLLAMCEFRNEERIDGDLDLQSSGYSADPGEARTQFLVVSANTLGSTSVDRMIRALDGPFLECWLKLRNDILDANPRRVAESPSIGVKEIKALFEDVSTARRQLLLTLGEALAKKRESKDKAAEAVQDNRPFDSETFKREHPLLFVPFKSLVEMMDQVAGVIGDGTRTLAITEYEVRRLAAIKETLPTSAIRRVLDADSRALAYALVVAAVGAKEERFAGSGVWKKLTESFEKQGRGDFQAMAEIRAGGTVLEAGMSRDFTLAVNQMQLCRRAGGEFLKAARSQRQAHVDRLFVGTTILRHVLNHPKYGPPLASMTFRLFQSLDRPVDALTRAELLEWDQQKDIPI